MFHFNLTRYAFQFNFFSKTVLHSVGILIRNTRILDTRILDTRVPKKFFHFIFISNSLVSINACVGARGKMLLKNIRSQPPSSKFGVRVITGLVQYLDPHCITRQNSANLKQKIASQVYFRRCAFSRSKTINVSFLAKKLE